jgi:hypothetical protein
MAGVAQKLVAQKTTSHPKLDHVFRISLNSPRTSLADSSRQKMQRVLKLGGAAEQDFFQTLFGIQTLHL